MIRFFILLVLFSGCVMPGQPKWQPHGSVVEIRQPKSIASGVVIGENLVITAAHCVDENGYIKIRVSKNPIIKYTRFYKLAEFSNPREPIVCVYGEYKFDETAIFEVGCSFPPAFVQTRRGLFAVDKFISMPGDSGSAVMDKHGHLLGVHYGSRTVEGERQPVFLLFKD